MILFSAIILFYVEYVPGIFPTLSIPENNVMDLKNVMFVFITNYIHQIFKNLSHGPRNTMATQSTCYVLILTQGKLHG